MHLPLRYRDIPLGEIAQLYDPRPVFDNDSSYTMQPIDPADGPVILEIPKTIPVDAFNRPIDLTWTIPLPTDFIAKTLGAKFNEPLQARIGRFTPTSSAAPAAVNHSGKLTLHADKPDAIELILQRQFPLSVSCWGKLDPPSFPHNIQYHVRTQSHCSTSWGQHADFWIVERIPALDELFAYCEAKFAQFLQEASLGNPNLRA